MQPPRPFPGASYDKDMFTFLPALANRDVLVESPRKRKLMASGHQITMPAPTVGYGSSANMNSKENAGDLRGREIQNFVLDSSPRKSQTFRNYSDSAKHGHQNESDSPWHSNKRDFYESRSECHGYNSLAGLSQSSNYKDLTPLFQSSAGLTYKPPNWSPSVTEDFNQHGGHDSNSHVGGEEGGFHFSKSRSYGQQKPTLMKVDGSDSNELALGQPQNLHQSFTKPGAYVVGTDEKGCHEHNFKVKTSDIQGLGDSSSFVRVDPTKMLGNNVNNSIYSLQETNNIIQQALRLLSASSGTGLTVNQDGSSQGCGDGSMTTLNSHTPNLSDPLNQRTLSKGDEAGLNLDKPIISGDKGSVNIDDRDNGGSVLAEKLWDGTLQLSSSSAVVSAIAFFKSGERMQDFSWSGSVEVKGKVRLEAFEKYVQDLPRARSRGLMVMSLCWKEGSSDAGVKAMTEVARKYKEGKKVGFAQLNKGVDMYICPHSDTIITILAKHGFFKGMSAVIEKSVPLLGCVVWRKNSISPSTITTVINENSEKIHAEIEGEKNNSGNKSPEFCVSPCVNQPEQSIIPEKKMTSISGNNKQLSEFNSNVEINKPSQSTVLSDDEDLPEYDFGAPISQISERKSSVTVTVAVGPTPEVELQPITAQIRSENSTVSQNKHQSEATNPSIQVQQGKHTVDCTSSSRPSVQGLAPQNMGPQPETMIPNWPVEGKKPVDEYHGTMNPKNLFDDDDMPEWCPPDFKKMKPEGNERVGPSFASRNSMVGGSSFTDLATGRQLPSPPLPPLPPPPPPPVATQVKFFDQKYPTEHQLPLPPPPPPPRPPPSTQGQFDKNGPSDPRLPKSATPPPHVQFQAKHYPPPGHMPPRHPLPPPPPPSTRPHFLDKDHPPAPHFPKPAVNNFMHNGPAAPSTHVRFQNQHYPPAPHLRPPVLDKNTANNFMHTSPAGVSTQSQFHNNFIPAPLARPPADKPPAEGSRHEFSPGFSPNPFLRPQFHQLGMNNHAHHSGWRSPRP